jgi:anti-sigma factor RsiW
MRRAHARPMHMQNTNPAHPSEEELERFVLHQCQEQELEQVETHILACESCVTRLEDLEIQIRATKLALRNMQAEQRTKAAATEKRPWKAWLTIPKLSIAGGLAAVALGVIAVPALLQRNADLVQVSLSAYRGYERSVVPQNRRLRVHLNAGDLADGTALAAVVDSSAAEIWKGRTVIHNEQAELDMPPIMGKGAYLLRLYAPAGSGLEPNLLREFAFQVK